MRTIVLSVLLVAAPALAQAADTGKTETTATATTRTAKRPKVVDINSASKEELTTLPGVTDELAQKIIEGRPYTGRDQLVKLNIVDQGEYQKLRPHIRAKQPKAIGGQGAAEKHTGPGPATMPAPTKGNGAAKTPETK